MKIFVQARKDGYNTLYPSQTPNEFRHFASDIILIRNEPENLHGKCVYSIAFNDDGYIFTQHIIVEDVQRAGLGNVGFSIFIHKNNKLSGNNIKNLLDELIKSYCKNYCNDFYLGNVQEDWVLFTSIANSYDSKIVSVSSEDNDIKQSGNLDAAFIYFTSDIELQKYFEQPLQEEYIPYRQIYFISNEFKDKPNPENPLYVLKNSGIDLTGQIDLENPSYKLREFHGNAKNGVSITIKNSKGRQLNNKDKIFRKDELTLAYTKKNYEEKKIIGSLLNSEEIRFYLNISNDCKIDVLKEVDLKPKEKTITFEVVKNDGSRISDAIITYKSNYHPEKQVLNNQVTFSGDDLNERWIVSAKIGDTCFSNNHIIDFEKDSLNPIKLTLNEKRVLKIIAKEYELPQNGIPKFNVWVQGKGNYNENDIEFVDDEINKSFNITVEGNGYERSEPQTYYPKDGNMTLYFHLKKPDKPIGDIKNNEKEKDSFSKKTEGDKKFYQKPKFIIFSIVSVLILCIGIWGLRQTIFKPKPNEKLFSLEQISNYLESDELILDTLKLYKANWEMQNPQNNTNDEGFLSSLLSDNENPNLSYETDTWYQISDSIDSAISKRELIDKMDFEKLEKENFIYQQSFEQTIHKVKKNKYELLKEKLRDISSLSLAEIESKIEEILNKQDSGKSSTKLHASQDTQTTPKVTGPSQRKGGVVTGSAEKSDKITFENTTGTSGKKDDNAANGNIATTTETLGINSEIKQKLKSGDITKIELEKYKNNTKDPLLINSIDLLSELWAIESSDNSCEKYSIKINNNSFLNKNSVLKNIIAEMKSKVKDSKSWGSFSKSESLNKILEKIKKK